MKTKVFIMLLAGIVELHAQGNRTVGLLINNDAESFDGYTLYSPHGNSSVYLINNCGELVHQWESKYPPGNAVYLVDDGTLFRAGKIRNSRINAGGSGGIIEQFSWEGEVLWQYKFSDDNNRQHHDFQVLPNGNVLMLAWEYKTKEEALAAGRKPELINPEEEALWPEQVIEVKPIGLDSGEVVWEWHAWDHLIQDSDQNKPNYGVIREYPEKININYAPTFSADWHHANAINYNPDLDQIAISIHAFNEFWLIDHSISTEAAAGPKGDLLYRWGNPQTYGQGDSTDQMLFAQHNVHWIPKGLPDEGKILIFNNGKGRLGEKYSAVVKVAPPLKEDGTYHYTSDSYLPKAFSWEYTAPRKTDFYSWFISGAQQLSNGNILIDDGAHGTFFEINNDREVVWKYVNPLSIRGALEQGSSIIPDSGERPDNIVFRAERYPVDFPGFTGKDLSTGEPIELNPMEPLAPCVKVLTTNQVPEGQITISPNPVTGYLKVTSNQRNSALTLVDFNGHVVRRTYFDYQTGIDLSDTGSGLYFVWMNGHFKKKLIIKH